MVRVCVDTKSTDVIEQLLWSHDIINLPRLIEEITHVATVSEEELQSVGVPGFNRLSQVYEIDVSIVPEHVVLAEISVNEMALVEHLLHSL